MKPNLSSGPRIYAQIVLPLLVASVGVGITATLITGYFLEGLATEWGSGAAENIAAATAHRMTGEAESLARAARLGANDAELRAALSADDVATARALVVGVSARLAPDTLLVLDRRGEVVAVSGAPSVRYGDRLFGADASQEDVLPRVVLGSMAGAPVLAALRPLGVGASGYTVAVTRAVDERLLGRLGVDASDVLAVYDAKGRLVASQPGSGLSEQASDRLEKALFATDGVATQLVSADGAEEGTSAELNLDDLSYQVHLRPVELGTSAAPESTLNLVVAVDKSVAVRAGETVRTFIALWSLVAVVFLVALGGWVAHRVSAPLLELAEGARRVADGDYSTKVGVSRMSEIGGLASTFNEMTDSLRERSETLTKKVLELATLYEMSRALGSTLDMTELLGSVLDSALRIFDLDLGYIALRDRDTDVLTVRALRGPGGSDADGAVRSSMSEWVVREGRPLIFNPDAKSGSEQIDTVTGAKAALCVPLISPEGPIGSITIGSSDMEYRFNSDDVRLLSTIANHVTIAIGNIELFSNLQDAYLATVRSLAAAVDAKDSYTRGHSEYVALFATMIAEKLGLSHEQKIALEMAAYLHDIGKIGVPEDILLKPDTLDEAEMAQMRHHPLIGANILKPVAFPWAITPVVRHHHEAWDGSGYPAGLKGEEIPLLARILAVADSYEAMTSDRPYRTGRTSSEALTELDRCADTQFDRRIVAAFVEAINEQSEAEQLHFAGESERVEPEEARAIFSVLVDGVLASFRRLGGPRLALNVERELDQACVGDGLPLRISHGRVRFTVSSTADLDVELEQMRRALGHVERVIGHLSGTTLVEHFFADALEELSGRMRALARDLELYRH